jgi:hypothetical protein
MTIYKLLLSFKKRSFHYTFSLSITRLYVIESELADTRHSSLLEPQVGSACPRSIPGASRRRYSRQYAHISALVKVNLVCEIEENNES